MVKIHGSLHASRNKFRDDFICNIKGRSEEHGTRIFSAKDAARALQKLFARGEKFFDITIAPEKKLQAKQLKESLQSYNFFAPNIDWELEDNEREVQSDFFGSLNNEQLNNIVTKLASTEYDDDNFEPTIDQETLRSIAAI